MKKTTKLILGALFISAVSVAVTATCNGNLDMHGFKITDLGAPEDANDATTKTYVDQLKMMDDGARKSQLDEMSKTNYILYGVVRALLDMTENKQDYAQKMQDKDEQQQG